MNNIHRRVFTLFLMEQDRHVLNSVQSSEMQAHLSTCQDCLVNLKLYDGLKEKASLRWREAAPEIDMRKVLGSVRGRSRWHWQIMPLQAVLWIGLGLLALVLFRWVFTKVNPAPAILPSSSPTPISLTPESTPLSTENAPAKIPVEPMWRGDPQGRGSWSPDGDYLFIPLLDSPPPGGDRRTTSLHFISAATGEDCPATETFLGPQGFQNYAWLDNLRVLFIDKEGRALLFTRCQPGSQDISGIFGGALVRVAMPTTNQELASPGPLLLESPSTYWLLDPDTLQALPLREPVPSSDQADGFAWIPSGHRISVIQPVAGKPELSTLVILDLDTGQVLRSIEAEASVAEGTPLVEWLGPERAYIWSMETTGPDMIDLSVDPPQQIRVFPELFELNLNYPDDISSTGVFFSPADGSYHIVVHMSLPEDKSIYLYHGEDGRVEKLAGDSPVLMILPGGHQMPLVQWEDTPSYKDEYDVVWVDKPEQPPIHLKVRGHTPRNYQLLVSRLRPGSTGMLFGSTQGISLVGLPGGETQAFWQLIGAENATYTSILPTPDGRGAIVFVSSSEAQDSPVYWLSSVGTPAPTRQVIGTQQAPAVTPTPQVSVSPQSTEVAFNSQVFESPAAQISTCITLTLLSKDDPTHAHWVDYFGGSVDIDGDVLVTGAPIWGRPPGEGTGAAYVYRRSPSGDWYPEATLIASDRDDGFQYDQHFGEAIAVNGTVIAVGAPGYDDHQAGDNIGAVYIFEYDGHSWVESTKLTPSNPKSGAKIGRMLAFDGDILAASGSPEAGYVSIFQRETGGWHEMAEVLVPSSPGEKPYVFIDLYGDTLAISTVIMPPEPETQDPKLYTQSLKTTGSVTLYEQTGEQWSQVFQTTPQEASLYKMYEDTPFGLPVSLTGEAGRATLLAVGKPGFTESGREAGSVMIYERKDGGWALQAELMLAPDELAAGGLYFFGPHPGSVFFGAYVDFDGNRLAVISTFANTVYVFEHQSTGWVYRYLVTPGPVYGDDFQRRTAAMSGSDLIIGSPGELGGGNIYVFSIPK